MKKNRQKIFTREYFMKLVVEFFTITGGVCILEGIIGCLFLPEARIGYDAYLSPPLFGICSILCGIILNTGKELGMWQAVIQKIVHLTLIELVVFGLNYSQGVIFETKLTMALILGIALVYVLVSTVGYLNDRSYAIKFNEELKEFQKTFEKNY